jgi:hypothetical protein
MASLLAVDLGLRTGYALYGRDGTLRWYRSKNFGSAARLRRGAAGLLGEVPDLAWLVLEGGGSLAEIWEREARRRKVGVLRVQADEWRRTLLYPRERTDGRSAKRNAGELARRVIRGSSAAAPTSLRHDAAEAVLTGLWGVLEVGWLEKIPEGLLRGAPPRPTKT